MPGKNQTPPPTDGWVAIPEPEPRQPDALDIALRAMIEGLNAAVAGNHFAAGTLTRMRRETADAVRFADRLTPAQRKAVNATLRSRRDRGSVIEVLRDVSSW